jgi:hypothetical protein
MWLVARRVSQVRLRNEHGREGYGGSTKKSSDHLQLHTASWPCTKTTTERTVLDRRIQIVHVGSNSIVLLARFVVGVRSKAPTRGNLPTRLPPFGFLGAAVPASPPMRRPYIFYSACCSRWHKCAVDSTKEKCSARRLYRSSTMSYKTSQKTQDQLEYCP